MSRSTGAFDRGFYGALQGFVHGAGVCLGLALLVMLAGIVFDRRAALDLSRLELNTAIVVAPLTAVLGAVRGVRRGPPPDDGAPAPPATYENN